MPKVNVWVKFDNGGNSTRVAIDEEDIVDDLCDVLKDTKFNTELRDIGRSMLDVKSPDDSHVRYSRDKIIKDLPTTTAEKPIIIGILPPPSYASNSSQSGSKFLTTPLCQNSTSTISNDSVPLRGFGSLPSSFRIDATDEYAVSTALCPTDTDIQSVSEDMPLIGELMDLIPRGEEDSRGVNLVIGLSSSLFRSVVNGRTTLHTINLDMGLATPASYCDHLLKDDKGIPRGLIELKSGVYSPLQGNRQAAIYGSHLAMGLLKLGIAPERIIVPTCTYTGMVIQFGATIVLKPSFPVFWTISKLLDMADANERRLAVAHINKANTWINQLLSLHHCRPPTTHLGMKLDTSAYHIKKLDYSACKRGFRLFSDVCGDISQGIEHWGRVLNLLYADRNVRSHVAFPLAIRSPNTTDDEYEYIIVYKNLCEEGYRSGCPDRSNEPELYNAFREEFRRIIALVHRAGVIHCDLYLSNVMWRKSAGSTELVDIIIIDWDCAHCIIEGRFHPKLWEALQNHQPSRGAEFGISFDNRYVNVLYREYDESERQYWIDLASGIKARIDTAFYALFSLMNTNSI